MKHILLLIRENPPHPRDPRSPQNLMEHGFSGLGGFTRIGSGQ